jgi:hypothetical protein
MRQAEFEQHVGAMNVCADFDQALERARVLASTPAVPTAF